MLPGFYTRDLLSSEAYHRGPGVSCSGLKLIADKTPAHYFDLYLNPEWTERRQSAALFVGTALHAATLEPDLFRALYLVNPYPDRRGNRYKEIVQGNPGKHILSQEEAANVAGMHRALHRHPTAGALLRRVDDTELSAYAIDPETGELVRIRMDLITTDDVIVDVKKTQDASPDGFRRAVANYSYFLQHAFYWDVFRLAAGTEPRAFVFIAVEEQPPHAVGVYTIDPEDVMRGRVRYRKALDLYAECRRTGVWPGYSDRIETLALPEWARSQLPALPA